MLPENQSVRTMVSGNLSRNLNTFHPVLIHIKSSEYFTVSACFPFHTNNHLIFKKAQLTDIKSIAEHITQTHALNVFEIMPIAAVTAYGKSQNALQRTMKLGNNQDIMYSDVVLLGYYF